MSQAISSIWQTLPRPFLALAPMEGVTDHVFRQVVAAAAPPDLFFTEFTNVSSFTSPAGRANALARLRTVPTDHPIIAQIWGNNPDHFRALASELESLGFDGLDLNMGCPDRHVNKAGGGAAMIRTPDLALECLREARAATGLPVSVKTRLGFSSISEMQDWLTLLLSENLPALTVHLRTRKEMSKVPAHFELIPAIIALRDQIAPTTKLIINGDIKNRAAAMVLSSEYPGIDGFMIGRGIFSDPFCFASPVVAPCNGSSFVELNNAPVFHDHAKLIQLLNLHLDLYDQAVASFGPRPFEPLKRFFKIYINSFSGASELREQLMHTKTTREVRAILALRHKTFKNQD